MKFYEGRHLDLAIFYYYNKFGDKTFYQFFAKNLIRQFLSLEDKDLSYYESSMINDNNQRLINLSYFDSLMRVDKETINALSEMKFFIKYQKILKIYYVNNLLI